MELIKKVVDTFLKYKRVNISPNVTEELPYEQAYRKFYDTHCTKREYPHDLTEFIRHLEQCGRKLTFTDENNFCIDNGTDCVSIRSDKQFRTGFYAKNGENGLELTLNVEHDGEKFTVPLNELMNEKIGENYYTSGFFVYENSDFERGWWDVEALTSIVFTTLSGIQQYSSVFLFKEVYDFLTETDFAKDYMKYSDAPLIYNSDYKFDRKDILEIIEGYGHYGKYHSKERFFTVEEKFGKCSLEIHIAFIYNQATVIPFVCTPEISIMGPSMGCFVQLFTERKVKGFSYKTLDDLKDYLGFTFKYFDILSGYFEKRKGEVYLTHHDFSEIDFINMKVHGMSKQGKEIADLCRACRFDEAAKLKKKCDKDIHQLEDMEAQLAFFRCEFDKAVEHIIDYLPYLGEWYSGNKTYQTFMMLSFAMSKASEKVRNEAAEILGEMSAACDSGVIPETRRTSVFREKVSKILDAANGNFESYHRKYSPPQKFMTCDEIIAGYSENGKYYLKKAEKAHCAPEDHPECACSLLLTIYGKGRPEDYIRIYEKHCRYSRMLTDYHYKAAEIYLYLGEPEKARQAILNHVKYSWIPMEYTDVMPLVIFENYNLDALFTEDFFREIYNTPKGVDEKYKTESENLRYDGDLNKLFSDAENVVTISKFSVPSGKILAADPLVYLDKDTLAYSQKVPKGEYDVKAVIANKAICAVRVGFTDEAAVKYVGALTGTESQAFIDELADGEYPGFPVDAGLAALFDDKTKKEFLKYMEKWYKKNKNGDFYTDHLAPLFEESYEKFPELQGEDGTFIDYVIPDTEYHVPIFSSGAGDGYYPVFFGYDDKNKVCCLAITFVDKDE